jgi:hypothetical protein
VLTDAGRQRLEEAAATQIDGIRALVGSKRANSPRSPSCSAVSRASAPRAARRACPARRTRPSASRRNSSRAPAEPGCPRCESAPPLFSVVVPR